MMSVPQRRASDAEGVRTRAKAPALGRPSLLGTSDHTTSGRNAAQPQQLVPCGSQERGATRYKYAAGASQWKQ
ncbi:hypothetical protein HETIRDRAFT_452599 [Heterobasidion irregulare TC 32-1]|uniref:Uncharacterized protein n=1 Tax=Heterobasidion irregulare (strain TC 32-1) TaxID=747525 RepID=W4K5Y5_HETIT|nr:uncharacterized protein HETIRDRAFT_452599 [Heterobasidion irregulare TC 32-1]ETW81223.1 hypothetical protein HETIRDRAFT_452599 [Heterobasidion irregulare TC 32-1]